MGPVLLVDDVASVRRALSLFLACAGYLCVGAESGEAALSLLRTGDPFGLLVTDQSMTGMTGCELIQEASRLRPGLPAMLVTGYDRPSGLVGLRRGVPVLRKPFERAEFVSRVGALLRPPAALPPATESLHA